MPWPGGHYRYKNAKVRASFSLIHQIRLAKALERKRVKSTNGSHCYSVSRSPYYSQRKRLTKTPLSNELAIRSGRNQAKRFRYVMLSLWDCNRKFTNNSSRKKHYPFGKRELCLWLCVIPLSIGTKVKDNLTILPSNGFLNIFL